LGAGRRPVTGCARLGGHGAGPAVVSARAQRAGVGGAAAERAAAGHLRRRAAPPGPSVGPGAPPGPQRRCLPGVTGLSPVPRSPSISIKSDRPVTKCYDLRDVPGPEVVGPRPQGEGSSPGGQPLPRRARPGVSAASPIEGQSRSGRSGAVTNTAGLACYTSSGPSSLARLARRQP
jgi:hypothetical protein